MQRGRLYVMVAITALAVLLDSRAQAAPPTDDSDDDLRILEIRLDRTVLSDAVPAFIRGDDVLLPLGEIARVLTIAVTVDTEQGTASGYVLSEARTFHLDATAGAVTLAGRKSPVGAALIEIQPDDLYVASKAIAQWLPVDLDVDLARLRLQVRAREPLPLQQRLERERHNRFIGAGASEQSVDYRRVAVPYEIFAIPTIDQTLGIELRRGPQISTTDASFSSYLTGDLFGMESTAFVSGRQHGDFQSRIALGRHDPEGSLLGPLQATSFALGSVPLPMVRNLSEMAAVGTGVTMSNQPLTRPQRLDSHTLQGDLLPGWDVELYQNGALGGYQQASADGRYRFEDVPLVAGTNDFRLVFRGPQGQLREERQTFLLEDSLVAPGEMYYRLAAVESQAGHKATVAQFDWGLSRNVSATTGVLTLPAGDETRRYLDFGLRANWGAMILNGEWAHAQGGGDLAELGLKTRLGSMTVMLTHTRLRAFSSDVFAPRNDPVSAQSELRLIGTTPSLGRGRLPFTLDLTHQLTESGREDFEISGRTSALVAGTWMTNRLRALSSGGVETFDGALQFGRGFRSFGVRGTMNYSITPDSELTALALTAERRLGLGYVMNAGMTRALVVRDTRYHLGASKQVGNYGLGVNGAYSDTGEITLNAQFFAALGREPRTADWVTQSLPMADSGLASVRVFLDDNLNGQMDDGEQPLQNVGFIVDGGRRERRTNAEGVAYLRRLPTRQNIHLAVDPSTLEDPQWSLGVPGVQLVPRAGRAAQVDFPVVMTGEVDGIVYVLMDKQRRPAGGVTLELLAMDPAFKLIRRIRTASDGFYVVESVPPGEYFLRVAPEDVKRARLTDSGTRIVTVSAKGDLISNIDLFLVSR